MKQRLFFTGILFVILSCNQSESKTVIEVKEISSPATDSCAEPYLFTDKNGLVFLSWIEKKNKVSTLKFSTLSGDRWTAPVTIATGDNWFVNWADYPLLTGNGEKNLVAHFLEKSEKGTYTYDVKLVTSADEGKTWSAPEILHDDGKKAEHGFVSMIPYQDNYFISWLDGRNSAMETGGGHDEGHHGQMTIRGATVDKKGKKSAEWELDNRVCDCCQTSAVITANGPVVVYRDRSEEEIRDISIVRLVNGKWTSPKPIFSDNWKISGCPVNGPRADARANNLVVAWFSSPAEKAQVNIVFSTDGGATFGTPIRIDEGEGIGRVDVVMLDDKSAMVSWMEGSVIKAVKVFHDSKKESSIIISTSSVSRSSGFPQMTKAGNKLIFAWTDDKNKTIKLATLLL